MALSLGTNISTRVTSLKINQGALDQLQRGRLSPVGRDLEARALRVTRRMKQNASGRPGPEIRTGTLNGSITSRIGEDGAGLVAQVGPLGSRTIKRGYNYALILEGLIPRGGAPPDGAYPFMERSLEAAR